MCCIYNGHDVYWVNLYEISNMSVFITRTKSDLLFIRAFWPNQTALITWRLFNTFDLLSRRITYLSLQDTTIYSFIFNMTIVNLLSLLPIILSCVLTDFTVISRQVSPYHGTCGKLLNTKDLQRSCYCYKEVTDGSLTISCNQTNTLDHVPSFGKDASFQDSAEVQKL